MDRKVCFISKASNRVGGGDQGGGRADSCPKADWPPTDSQGARAFIDRERAACRNSTVSSDTHLETGPAVLSSASSGLF